jgi:site-specific recombinase XerD
MDSRRQAALERTLRRFEAEYLDLNNVSLLRRREQLRLLRKFAATLDHPLVELTPSDLRGFIGGMLRDGLAPSTGTKYMGMFRSFITWAYEANLIDSHRRDQLSLVGNPRGGGHKSRPNPYKPREIADFYALLHQTLPLLPAFGSGSRMLESYQRGRAKTVHTRLWRHAWRLQIEAQVALALEAGLRRIEIHSLSIPALHPDNSEIVVLTAKQGPGREVRRSIPYTDHARYWVGQWLDFRHSLGVTHEEPWLGLDIYGSHGRQLDPITLFRMGRSLELRLHTQHWRWHRFRHTAATEWLRAGVPLERVQRFMGHANIEQTLAYAELLNEDISESFGKAQDAFSKRLGLRVPVDGEAA